MQNEYPYQVYSPLGGLVLESTIEGRYPAKTELHMLEAGFTIRLYGRKLTKADVKKRGA